MLTALEEENQLLRWRLEETSPGGDADVPLSDSAVKGNDNGIETTGGTGKDPLSEGKPPSVGTEIFPVEGG